jgi:hypothetical protein
MALTHAHAFCEHKVTMAPADRPWDTIVIERFNGYYAERDAKRLADSLQGIENAIVNVSCQQCW